MARLAALLLLAGLAVLPLHSFAGTEAGVVARLGIVGVLVLAAARPDRALLVCAGLAPLGGPLGVLLGSPVSLTEPLALAFLGGWLLHEGARHHREDAATRAIVIPALLFSGTVAASCAAQLMVLQKSVDHGWPFLRHVIGFMWRDYFFDRGTFQAVTTSMLLLEGTALFFAVVMLSRRTASYSRQVARMVAACGAAVAALNINRLLTVSLRSGLSLKELAAGAYPLRISSVFPDVNSAGSYLAMVLLISVGLAFTKRSLRAGWVAAACVTLAALWLTGSRAAHASVPAAAVVAFAAAAMLRRRSLVRLVLVAVLAAAFAVLGAAYLLESPQRVLSGAISVRLELAHTGLRMFATHPVFGVGVGRYYPLSSEFSSPELRRIYPRENAHNNFLQILAELGIVGFALFLWMLVAVARRVWCVRAASRASPTAIGVVGGLVAFLLTCLAGHPLLVREVAYAFWMVLGLTAALALGAPAPADDQHARAGFITCRGGAEAPPYSSHATGSKARWFSRRRLGWVIALLLLISVPIQGRLMLAEADLEHAAIGFSAWQRDGEGVRFRWMAGHAQFYVPSNARAVKLPLRLEPAAQTDSWPLEIYLEGRLGTRVTVDRRAWREVRFMVPQVRHQPRFLRVELRVPRAQAVGAGPDQRQTSAPPRIQVGRLELTMPPS